MSRIKILPELLSNKIAAGEVVERPASVVKELVENALDAGGTLITLEVARGGRSLIRVSDNGSGMSRDDALLCIERYATSKIRDEKDLFAIATLGFRGEALPSIASVSEMEIVTKTSDSDAGTRLVVSGGKIKSVSEVGAPDGTMVSVNRLFFNTPARLKHLKTDRTEMARVSDVFARIALAWPSIHFKFISEGKPVVSWGPVKDHLHRVVAVLEDVRESQFHRMAAQGRDVGAQGFLAPATDSRATKGGLYVYVNGRFVRDRVLDHAVLEGYAGRLMKGRFPVAVVFVTVPPERVDVNVHPTKDLVRFETPDRVHDTIAEAVRIALASRTPRAGQPAQAAPAVYTSLREKRPAAQERIGEPAAPFKSANYSPPATATATLWEKAPFSALTVLGQLHGTYIVCESEEGLALIDQHAAHERVLFESLKAAYARSSIAAQRLLVPEKLELTHREADIFESMMESLFQLGFEAENFGGRSYLIKSVPDVLADKPVKRLIMDLIEKTAEIGVVSELREALDGYLILMACHGAIRANQRLSLEEMKTLLRQLDGLEKGMHCPHGRPVMIRKGLRDLEKEFKRIV